MHFNTYLHIQSLCIFVKMNITLINFILIHLISFAKCANILFFAPTPSHSHQVIFQPVIKELSLKGHKVTAITPEPFKDMSLVNLTEIDLGILFEPLKKEYLKYGKTNKYLIQKPDFLTVFLKETVMADTLHTMGKYILTYPEMQKFLNQDHKFDVVIVEWMHPTFAALAAKFKAPLIGITSLGASVPALDTVGNPSHPVYSPDHNLPFGRVLTFKERLMSLLYAVYIRMYYKFVVLPREDKLVREYMGEDIPYLGDVERNVSLILLNRNPVLHRIMPVVPAVIELGYMNKNKETKPLSKNLQCFLDNSKHGVIYFSLGSNIEISDLPQDKLNAIINTFKTIKYDVILKCDIDKLNNKPDNVLIQKWFPQEAILKHPNLKLFIMQGGLQSSDEAIINQVPVIAIPFCADQTTNADALTLFGLGKYLEYEDITQHVLTEYINEIISNPSYKKKAMLLSKLYTDQPSDGLKKAIWWIEYVIRHRGAPHLRSPLMDLPMYQYFMLDTLFVIFLYLVVIILLTLKCITFCVRKINELFSIIKNKAKKD